MRDFATNASCDQDIAGDSAFAVSMLAEFDRSLGERGPWCYRALFWETGLIGQVLYLEAEALGVRSTGIGCFFDDAVHHLLGLPVIPAKAHAESHDVPRPLQALYHFTVGGPVEDDRLQTLPAYFHRAKRKGEGATG